MGITESSVARANGARPAHSANTVAPRPYTSESTVERWPPSTSGAAYATDAITLHARDDAPPTKVATPKSASFTSP